MVTKLWASPFSRVFKEEHILQLENVSLRQSNMQVVAYVPTYYMNRVNNNTQAEVIVNDKVKFRATVELLGARTEELPEELRNSLSHTYTSVMVVFSPDRDQVLPLWAAVDRVPVRVRIKNYDNGRRNDGSDYWYITRDGLTEESKYYLGMLRQKKSGRYHYHPDEIPALDTVQQGGAQQGGTAAVRQDSVRAGKPETAEAARTDAAATKQAANGGAEVDPKTGYILHHVQRGETVYGIAEHYGVTQAQIFDLNPGTEEILYAGTTIRIPPRSNK